jgi:hypothetical protein
MSPKGGAHPLVKVCVMVYTDEMMKLANGFALASGFSLLLGALFQSGAQAATDINWVQNELDSQQFTSIEAFLAALTQDYRSSYALMYDSNSLQRATPLEPRVISYGTDASLILAFNSGDSTLGGSDTVELIQFNEPETKFEFYEISKSSLTGKLQLTSETTKCEACHRSDPRPNWQPYDNWPGAYGSNDDMLAAVPTEQTNFADFVKVAANNPRYATLLNLSSSSSGDEVIGSTPNTALINRIAQWNYMRAARLVRASQNYAAYKYAILGSADCYSSFEEFFPKNNQPPTNWNTLGGSQDGWANAFIYIFASRNIAWQDWTTMIDGQTSASFDNNPFVAGYTYGTDLIANIVKQDVELQAYATYSESNSYDNVMSRDVTVNNCDALATVSVQALSAL